MELEKKDIEILLTDEYFPASKYLGEGFDNWYYHEHLVQSEKKMQIFVNGHTHNLPIVSRSIIFKWLMPQKPFLYSEEDFYSDSDRKAGIYRLSVGEKISISEKELKEIAKGYVKIDSDYLKKLQELVEKSFTFYSLKIPIVNIRLDEIPDSSFNHLYEIHTGSWVSKIKEIEEQQKEAQEKAKIKSLLQVKDTLSSFPDYLSILKDLVSGKISINEVESKNVGIFVKGI
jgi:hypothetical protein